MSVKYPSNVDGAHGYNVDGDDNLRINYYNIRIN